MKTNESLTSKRSLCVLSSCDAGTEHASGLWVTSAPIPLAGKRTTFQLNFFVSFFLPCRCSILVCQPLAGERTTFQLSFCLVFSSCPSCWEPPRYFGMWLIMFCEKNFSTIFFHYCPSSWKPPRYFCICWLACDQSYLSSCQRKLLLKYFLHFNLFLFRTETFSPGIGRF